MGLCSEDLNVHAYTWKVHHAFKRNESLEFYIAAVIKFSVKADPEGEGPPTREEEEEEEEGEKMQANPAYLPIEMMSYKSQESKYINVSSWTFNYLVCIE